MIYLYIATLVVGGVLLASSMLLGDHDGDIGADHAFEAHADAAGDGLSALLVGFRSFRFWIFFSAFFGLTGLVITGFGLVGSKILVAVIALGMGFFAGSLATWVLRRLSIEETGKVPTSGDYVGKTARVLVPIEAGGMGKVRLALGGTSVDMVATAEGETLAAGDSAVIIEIEGTTAKVTRFKTGE